MLPFSHYEHVLLEKSEEKTSEVHTSEVFSPSGSRAPSHRGLPPPTHTHRLSTGFLQSHQMDVNEMMGGCRLCCPSQAHMV